MILKIFKAVWFLSLLGLLINFMFIYASLPEQLTIHEGVLTRTVSREGLFYSAVVLFAICNVQVFVISGLYHRSSEEFLCWFYGLIIVLNIFFIICLHFINVYNSGERFNYQSIGVVIYGSVTLVVAWAVGWPFYWMFRKKIDKSIV